MTWLAIACSGPGAMALIESNERWGQNLAIAAAVVAAFAVVFAVVKRRTSRWLWATLVAGAIHPGWWMSGRSGDCGGMLYTSAVAWTIVVVVLALLTARSLRAPRETLEPAA